jgi:hypothetical protein
MTTPETTISPPQVPPTVGGRGNTGGRGRGGRHRARGRGGGTKQGQGVPRVSGFKGATPEMNGNVFECYDEQYDRRQYTKTVEALESYVKKNITNSEDLQSLFADETKEPAINEPEDPEEDGAKATKLQGIVYIEQVKGYVKRLNELKSNLGKVHAVIWGQCSEAMKAKIKSLTDYKSKTEANDCFWLLKQLKAVTLQFDEKRNVFVSLLEARTSLMKCKQEQGQTVSEYLEVLRG